MIINFFLSFRYWDWAFEAPLPDMIAIHDTVEVHQPDGQYKEIPNPLYSYYFDPSYTVSDDGLPNENHVRYSQSPL